MYKLLCILLYISVSRYCKQRVSKAVHEGRRQQLININTTINFIRYSVTDVGALSAAALAWSARGRHATVGSGRGWLGVVVARQADLSGWLGATGRCASTGRIV